MRPWHDGDEFWEMSPGDFKKTYHAYLVREDRLWFRTAWLASHLMAPHLKGGKAPKIDKLLGRNWPFARQVRL
jgi:hypothetical protein